VSQFSTQSPQRTFPFSGIHSKSSTHLNSTPAFAAPQLSTSQLSHFEINTAQVTALPHLTQPQVILRHSANLLLGTPCLLVVNTLGQLLLRQLAFPWPWVLFAVLLCAVVYSPQFLLYFARNPPLPHFPYSIPLNFNPTQPQPQFLLNFYNSIPLDFASPNFSIYDPNTALLSALPQSAHPQGCPRHSPNLLMRAPRLSFQGIRGHLPLHTLAAQWPRVLITLLLGAIFRPNTLFILPFLPGCRFGTSGAVYLFTCWQFSGQGF